MSPLIGMPGITAIPGMGLPGMPGGGGFSSSSSSSGRTGDQGQHGDFIGGSINFNSNTSNLMLIGAVVLVAYLLWAKK